MNTKRSRRTIFKKRKKQTFEKPLSEVETKSVIDDYKEVTLSPLSQKILECRIGSNITAREPWVFVKKENILDNIELHEHSSEFLGIKNVIENYTEDQILIGSYGHEQDLPEIFMICTTPEAVKITLAAVEAQDAKRRQQVAESICKACKSWHSLGSEIELNENLSLRFRDFYQVHLTLETPWFVVRCKFKERSVEDSPDGYVELPSTNKNFKNVYRKRIHSHTQCAIKVDKITQVDINPEVNQATKMMSFNVHLVENLEKTDALDEKYIFDLLQTNYYMDLCNEDYNFSNAKHMNIYQIPHCVLSFQDVFTCWGKKVSDVSWNALKSGILATAYVKNPSFMILNKEISYKRMKFCEEHLVLVWTYQDINKPHLYLHSTQEITTINFCPHDENIIIGGSQGGQIVVWDISGRLERCEKLKVLTKKQLDHRRIIEEYVEWMKPPPEVEHVHPVLVSNVAVSHLSPISYMEWLPPNQYITDCGRFKKSNSENVSMQFLSCSMVDGCISIWDLGVPKNVTIKPTRKSRRLKQPPDGLKKFVSPLRVLKKLFKPVFKICLFNPVTKHPLLIIKLLDKQSDINYKALNPETARDIYKRTHFQHIIEEGRKIEEQKFFCGTVAGEFYSIQWDYYDYDPGSPINSRSAIVNHTKTYHDGPIIVCMESPVIKDLILTVGGKVFAVWNGKNLQVPIFWRKAAHRYVAGSWLSTHPFQFCLIRNDTFKEIWDLMNDSKKPLKIIKWKGRAATGLFNDFKVNHVKKNTFVETNVSGEIKVFLVAFKTIKGEELEAVINYLHEIELQKDILANRINSIKAKFEFKKGADEIVVDVRETRKPTRQQFNDTIADIVPVKKRRCSINIIRNKWQAKEEAYMRKKLIAKKRVDITMINKNTELVEIEEKQRKEKYEKISEKIEKRKDTMATWKVILIPKKEFVARNKITVNFPKDIYQYMKQRYIKNYECIKKQVIDNIRVRKYKYFYIWADSVGQARALYKKSIGIKYKYHKDLPNIVL